MHLGEMLCAPFVPSNKPGSVTAPGAGGRRGRKENCLSSMCECHKACIEGGGGLRWSFLSLETFPSKSEVLWSCLCLLRDSFMEPDLIFPSTHQCVFSPLY